MNTWYNWIKIRILPTNEEFKPRPFKRKFQLSGYRKIDKLLPLWTIINISVPLRPMKPSQKFITSTFKATTNLAADKTAIKYLYMASVLLWEDKLELVGLVPIPPRYSLGAATN